jgi:hypothetical protein
MQASSLARAGLFASVAALWATAFAQQSLSVPQVATIGGLPRAGASAPTDRAAMSATLPSPVSSATSSGGDDNTLRRIEELQRASAVRELEAKLAAASSGAAGSAPSQLPALPGLPAAGAQAFEPAYGVISVVQFSGRTIADVAGPGGVILTVAKGDQLGEWTVSGVEMDGVTVEREVDAPVVPGKKDSGRKIRVARHLNAHYVATELAAAAPKAPDAAGPAMPGLPALPAQPGSPAAPAAAPAAPQLAVPIVAPAGLPALAQSMKP